MRMSGLYPYKTESRKNQRLQSKEMAEHMLLPAKQCLKTLNVETAGKLKGKNKN